MQNIHIASMYIIRICLTTAAPASAPQSFAELTAHQRVAAPFASCHRLQDCQQSANGAMLLCSAKGGNKSFIPPECISLT